MSAVTSRSRSGKADRRIYRRILAIARPYWAPIFAFVAVSFLSAPLALMKPVPVKIAIDSGIGGHPLPEMVPGWFGGSQSSALLFAAVLMILVAVIGHVQSLAGWLLQSYVGERLVLDFRARLFRQVQRLSFAYHDTKGTADSTYRIQNDAPSIQHVTVYRFIPLLTNFLTFALTIVVMARLDWQLTLVSLAVSPLIVLQMRFFGNRLRQRWRRLKSLDSEANSVVQEVLSSVRLVKAFGREDEEHGRFVEHSGRRVHEQLRVSTLQGLFELFIGVTAASGTALGLYIGASHVNAGTLTVGELLMMMAYMGQFYDPLKSISKRVAALQASIASVERSFALLDELPDVPERPNARPLHRAVGVVSFRNVSFAYDGTHPVLRGVSFDVPAGTRVGIQGRTGAGKSTIVTLLPRFYDVDDGQILVDGVDVRDYRVADLRNQFAIVLQDTVLFSTTIRENIAYGKPGASDEDVVAAARLANAHDFILSLPNGYDTEVGERGLSLSGGERQRISLARAFLKDAPILILDEPTSSVDSETEAVIVEALDRLMRGRTTFMIAHRLSTLAKCDMRLVVDDGSVQPLSLQLPA